MKYPLENIVKVICKRDGDHETYWEPERLSVRALSALKNANWKVRQYVANVEKELKRYDPIKPLSVDASLRGASSLCHAYGMAALFCEATQEKIKAAANGKQTLS